MRLAFELSGESNSIPKAEILALFSGTVILQTDRVLVMDVPSYDAKLGDRLAMTHTTIEIKDVCAQELASIYRAARHIELPNVKIAVRAKRIGLGLQSTAVEAMIGQALCERGYKIDLTNPDLVIKALLSDDVCIIGTTLFSANRSGFEARRPHLRPFFYPGVLLPRVARATVNLTGVNAGELLFDPFCGTGGILLEAALTGVRVVGSDVDSRMIWGTRVNLDYYHVGGELLVQDAKQLGFSDKSIDAVVTDIPYGRSVSICAPSLNQLKEEAFREIFRVLKGGRRAVLISHDPIADELASAGFAIEQRHAQYVHKSLTREINVARK